MYDRRFLASKVGLAAIASVTAMVTFNIYAFSQQIALAPAGPAVAAVSLVELA